MLAGRGADQPASAATPTPSTPTPTAPLVRTQDDAPIGARAVMATVTKYYYFNDQRIAMSQGGVLSYLHGDHLGGTAGATTSNGTWQTEQGYRAYGPGAHEARRGIDLNRYAQAVQVC